MSQFKKYIEIFNEVQAAQTTQVNPEKFLPKLAELLEITEKEFNKKDYLKEYFMVENGKVVFKSDFNMKENYLEFLKDMMPTFINSRSVEVNKHIVQFDLIAKKRKSEEEYIEKDANQKIAEINKNKEKKLKEIENDADFLYSITE
jgi:CRISPR/Cas system-associated protein endoribonuclease Cas2